MTDRKEQRWAWRLGLLMLGGLAGGGAIPGVAGAGDHGASRGDQVAVVYNTRLPESRALAMYYAERRGVPTNQVQGFELSTGETITRLEFQESLERPLLRWLQREGLLVFRTEVKPGGPGQLGDPGRASTRVTGGKIRYVVLCLGVPLRIAKDDSLREPGMDRVLDLMRRNEAAVDSELALLPLSPGGGYQLTGAHDNPVYGGTNAHAIKPEAGLLMVARLDGPSAAIARRMLDDAMAAETNGLWGRAYFDARGLTNGGYLMGDQWIRGAAESTRQVGFETVLDNRPELFSAEFPLSQVAFYAGWYSGGVVGALARTNVEFMPGSVAYHLHSFNAETVRSADRQWVGPLLARGATASFGTVYEPYLAGTFDLPVFFTRFMVLGFTFGEAAYVAQPLLSWQGTVVGDPLYCPFGRRPGQEMQDWMKNRYQAMDEAKSPQFEWACLQVANLTEVMGYGAKEAISYLEQVPLTRESALLSEKLGDLYFRQGRLRECLEANARALTLPMSPQQRTKVTLSQAQTLALFRKTREAFELYQQFMKQVPEYPDRLGLYRKMLPLARELNETAEVTRLEAEIQRMTEPAAPK